MSKRKSAGSNGPNVLELLKKRKEDDIVAPRAVEVAVEVDGGVLADPARATLDAKGKQKLKLGLTRLRGASRTLKNIL